MYRRSKFLEVLIEIRQEMAREADFDTDLFAEMVRAGNRPADRNSHQITDQDPRAKAETPGGRKRKIVT